MHYDTKIRNRRMYRRIERYLNLSFRLVVSINPITFETTSTGSPKTFLWTVVSRRSCKRAGTRLFRRGIDSGGNVANYVETEQIIEFEGNHSSYVQVIIILNNGVFVCASLKVENLSILYLSVYFVA